VLKEYGRKEGNGKKYPSSFHYLSRESNKKKTENGSHMKEAAEKRIIEARHLEER